MEVGRGVHPFLLPAIGVVELMVKVPSPGRMAISLFNSQLALSGL